MKKKDFRKDGYDRRQGSYINDDYYGRNNERYYVSQKRKSTPKDLAIIVTSILISVVLIVIMVCNVPIINFETVKGSTITTQQVSVLKYWKMKQPLVERSLAKILSSAE